MSITPGTWSVRKPCARNRRHAICAPGVRSICVVNRADDAHLLSAAKEMHFITNLVAGIPTPDGGLPDDFPIFGVNGHYITMGDVRAARRALSKAQGDTE